jgi:hypothetical protein
MEGGVRIRHAVERNAILSAEDPARPYTSPFACPICKVEHTKKTYHFRLDDTGSAIVAPQVVERLKPLGGFSVTDMVRRPPPQNIGLAGQWWRVQHESARSCRLVIEDEMRPYTVPVICPLCNGKVHTKKAYHLGLDSQGRAYISREIFERLVLRRIPGVMLQASTDPVVSDQLPIKQHSPPALSVVRRGRKEN